MLSFEKQTKVCIITDIAKLIKLYQKRLLSTEEFDVLYDCPLDQLEKAHTNMQDSMERDAAIQSMYR